jgi:Aldehyde dehydrogenase family
MLGGIERTYSGIQIALEQEFVEPIEVFERLRRQADPVGHLLARRAAVSWVMLRKSDIIAIAYSGDDYITGPGENPIRFERTNPMTNEAASQAQAMTPADASAVADRAALGFITWSASRPAARRGALLRESVGTILGIAQWNAPHILGVRAIAVPLACGNSVYIAREACALRGKSAPVFTLDHDRDPAWPVSDPTC